MSEMQVQVFQHGEFGNVRVVYLHNEPHFVAKDVCAALGIANNRDALSRLEDDEKGVVSTDTLGGKQEMQVVNEPGLYSLVLGSRKPEAKEFKRWITHDVIPSIRKHGAYMTPETIEKTLLNPDFIINLAGRLKEEQEARIAAETKLNEQAPKVMFADAVSISENAIPVGDVAKLLRQNRVEIGRDRLFKKLRDDNLLISHGESHNMPTQYSMERDLFKVKERTTINPDGSVQTYRTPLVTGKGQVFLINKYGAKIQKERTAPR